MEQPLAVANYFVQKSMNDGAELTPMKLVKLTYIAHGWYLALSKGQPLISEAVQAWKYGPVVPGVYHAFKKYGVARITALEPSPVGIPVVHDPEVTRFLDRIWEVYKRYTGLELSTLTHQKDTPWDIVWNQKNGKENYGEIIPNEIIREHYDRKIAG